VSSLGVNAQAGSFSILQSGQTRPLRWGLESPRSFLRCRLGGKEARTKAIGRTRTLLVVSTRAARSACALDRRCHRDTLQARSEFAMDDELVAQLWLRMSGHRRLQIHLQRRLRRAPRTPTSTRHRQQAFPQAWLEDRARPDGHRARAGTAQRTGSRGDGAYTVGATSKRCRYGRAA